MPDPDFWLLPHLVAADATRVKKPKTPLQRVMKAFTSGTATPEPTGGAPVEGTLENDFGQKIRSAVNQATWLTPILGQLRGGFQAGKDLAEGHPVASAVGLAASLIPGGNIERAGNEEIANLARDYVERSGITPNVLAGTAAVDADKAKVMAHVYQSLKSDPTHPDVRAAYAQLGSEVDAQYKAIHDAGYTIKYVDKDAYKNSKEMMADLRDNRELKVLKTSPDQSHPLLTPEQNDHFRAVHDFFGHAQSGNQFGPKGEENAFRDHSSMFSPQAARAMATETRGQNSWVNFGPKSDLPVTERPFAEQKAALWPEGLMGGAAIQFPGKAPYVGVTHGFAGLDAIADGLDPYQGDGVHGFMTTHGRFVDRNEAYDLAKNAAQTTSSPSVPGRTYGVKGNGIGGLNAEMLTLPGERWPNGGNSAFDTPAGKIAQTQIKRIRAIAADPSVADIPHLPDGTLRPYEISQFPNDDGGAQIVAHLPGDPTKSYGTVSVGANGQTGGAWVHKDLRRQGIATAMYDHAEKNFGPLTPSDNLMPLGQAFWDARSSKAPAENWLAPHVEASTPPAPAAIPKLRFTSRVADKPSTFRDTPSVTKQRIADSWQALSQPVPTERPSPRGILDRSIIRPDEGPTNLPLPPRAEFGTRQASGHMKGVNSPENVALIEAQARRGLDMGAARTFYPSVSAVLDALAQHGADPTLFNHATTAAAIRNSVPGEIVGGSAMHWGLKQGVLSPEELHAAATAGGKMPFQDIMARLRGAFAKQFPDANGLQLMDAHGGALQKRLAGQESAAHKIPMYGAQKLGDAPGFVLDTHESRGGTLATPYHRWFSENGGFESPEYGTMESIYRPIAQNLGLSDRTFQAARWAGGGHMTGLLTPPTSDYAQIFEDILAQNAQHRGLDPQALLRDVAKGKTALYFPRKR